jgi:uncharacterized caspase-like protein
MIRARTTAAAVVFALAAMPALPQARQATRPIEDYLAAEDVPRYALAIGVEHYDYLPLVPNALNDLDAAVRLFHGAGFNTVLELPDPSLDAVRTSVKQLVQLVEGTERPAVVVIFFAGHGFQDREANFIVPRDATPENLEDGSVAVANIVVRLAPRRAGVDILLLDACRTLTALGHTKDRAHDPIPLKPGFWQTASFDGAILSLAPGFNQAALSRATDVDVDSPYTEGLKQFLNRPELSLAEVFGRLYKYVKLVTNGRQDPQTLTQAAIDTLRFMPRTSQADLDAEQQHWRATLESGRPDCVKGFVIDFPDSRFVKSALRWLAELPPGTPVSGGGIGCPERAR